MAQALHDQEAFAAAPQQLLNALAEQLKTPFLQIARRAEYARTIDTTSALQELQQIEISADTALQLIDSYLLSMRLHEEQAALELTPVSLSSLLYDASHQLEAYARQYQVDLELHIAGKYAPVMAHPGGMLAAIMSLGHVLIDAEAQGEVGRHVLTLAAHRISTGGIAAGVFTSTPGLTTDMYRRARQLYGRARQPLGNVTASTGAGIFVADSLFASMHTMLRVAQHNNLTGLAATLLPSKQLVLV